MKTKQLLDAEFYQRHKERIKLLRKESYYKNREFNINRVKQYQKNNPYITLKANLKQLEKHGKILNMNTYEYSFAIQSWSKTIKKLDKNMCKLCDSRENLNAHHIQPKQDFPELSLDLDNGITLCKECHNKIHY